MYVFENQKIVREVIVNVLSYGAKSNDYVCRQITLFLIPIPYKHS